MIKRISGNKYNFEVIQENSEQDNLFSIRAISKSDGKYSSINNLNGVLSELGVDSVKDKYTDSMWILSKKEAKHFFNHTLSLLSNISFSDYLENRLDEDRLSGEWENS